MTGPAQATVGQAPSGCWMVAWDGAHHRQVSYRAQPGVAIYPAAS